ncbi:MAG: GerMN domain-containing protein [Thermoanaerobaculaceae bacterium]|jgi:hypothetical protein
MRALRPIAATLAVVAVLAAVVLLSLRHRAPAPSPAAEPAAPTAVPGKLVLFFPGDDALLHREAREVPELPAGALPRIRLVLEELMAGSREGLAPAFPWPASVQAVFLDREGDAFVDLSTPPPDTASGSDIEMTLVFATVNSVVANCPGVRRVQLIFGGHEVATLGHLDLSRPLAPRVEMVAP